MKKYISRILAVAGAGVLAMSMSACATNSASNELIVGASPAPHAKILQYLQDSGEAEKAGIKITVKQFTDYIQPNKALDAGDIDANYFQTVPYLESESASRGYNFAHGEGVHLEPVAVFSDKIKSLEELSDGATIAVINDPSNQGRQLQLLAQNGLLEVANAEASVVEVQNDAAANPRGFKFHELDGPALAKSLPDVDIAVINGNFAQEAGLSPDQSLAIEGTENNPAVNILAWRADETNKLEAILKLEQLLHSQATKDFIQENWSDVSVLPSF